MGMELLMRLFGRSSEEDPALEEFVALLEGNAHLKLCLKKTLRPNVVVLPDEKIRAFRTMFPGVPVVGVSEFRVWEKKAGPESRAVVLDALLGQGAWREIERSSRRPGRVFRVLHDLFPACVATTGLDNKPIPGLLQETLSRFEAHERLPDLSYFVLGLPRSGSHFLCDLLSSAGLGAPKEHVKRPFVNAWNKRAEWNFDARVWFENLIRTGQVANVFGTKIVHEIDVVGIQKETDLFSTLFDKGILLSRRDKVLQAISLYRARTLDYWHDRGSQGEPGVLDYSFEGTLKMFRNLERQEKKILAGLDRISTPVHRVTYEDLTAEPAKTMRGLADFLGEGKADLSRLRSSEKKIGTSREEEMAERFESDYRQRFGEACPRF